MSHGRTFAISRAQGSGAAFAACRDAARRGRSSLAAPKTAASKQRSVGGGAAAKDRTGAATRVTLWAFETTLALSSQIAGRLPRLFKPSVYLGGLHEVPGHADVAASGQFEVGNKRRFRLAGGERMSLLTDATGRNYVLSQGQGRGGFGKLRVGLGHDGTLYAVKEMRLAPRIKEPLPGEVRLHTKVSSPKDIKDEVAMMAAASRSMKVHACIEVQGKVYLFLPLMADDATTLAMGTPPFARVPVGRCLLMRACDDLEAIHRRGYIHHDVKLRNILWDAAGAVKFADFGLACKADASTAAVKVFGHTDGNMPLEHELHQPFDRSLDTFMLGLAMADYYAPDMRQSPEPGQALQQIKALETWRRRVLDGDGRLVPARLHAPEVGPPEVRMWNRLFAQVHAADPDICALVVERMLNQAPSKRATPEEVRALVESLQPDDGPSARLAQQVMRAMAKNAWGRGRLLRHMRYFLSRVNKSGLV